MKEPTLESLKKSIVKTIEAIEQLRLEGNTTQRKIQEAILKALKAKLKKLS